MAGFLSLPDDIIPILHFCGNPSTFAMARTCRRFHNIIVLPAHSMTDLLQIERWLRYDRAATAKNHLKQAITRADFFACYLCLRLQSISRDAQRTCQSDDVILFPFLEALYLHRALVANYNNPLVARLLSHSSHAKSAHVHQNVSSQSHVPLGCTFLLALSRCC